MSATLSLKWQPNVRDVRAGIHLSLWGTRARLARTLLLSFFLPGFAFAVLGPSYGAGLAFGLLFGGLFLFVFPTFLAWQVARKQSSYSPVQVISVSEESVERTAAGSSTRNLWSAVTRVIELPSLYVLFAGSIPVCSIEKSAAQGTESLEQLRVLLTSITKVHVRSSSFLAFERRNAEA